MNSNSKIFPALLQMAKDKLPSEDVMWDVFAELRLKLANPKTKYFYDELRKLFPNEFKQPLEQHAYN